MGNDAAPGTGQGPPERRRGASGRTGGGGASGCCCCFRSAWRHRPPARHRTNRALRPRSPFLPARPEAPTSPLGAPLAEVRRSPGSGRKRAFRNSKESRGSLCSPQDSPTSRPGAEIARSCSEAVAARESDPRPLPPPPPQPYVPPPPEDSRASSPGPRRPAGRPLARADVIPQPSNRCFLNSEQLLHSLGPRERMRLARAPPPEEAGRPTAAKPFVVAVSRGGSSTTGPRLPAALIPAASSGLAGERAPCPKQLHGKRCGPYKSREAPADSSAQGKARRQVAKPPASSSAMRLAFGVCCALGNLQN